MAAIIKRRRWTRQPTGPLEVDWSNPLTAGLAALFCGSDPSLELVHRQRFLANGSPTRADSGVALVGSGVNAGASYDGWYAPSSAAPAYQPAAPPLTLLVVGGGAENAPLGTGISQVQSSGASCFGLGFYYGSIVRGATASVTTTGGSITPSSNTDFDPRTGLHVACLSVGTAATWLYGDTQTALSYATPSGAFAYPAYDSVHAFSIVGSYRAAGSRVAAAALLSGVAWGVGEYAAFYASPWQIFRPRTRRFYFGAASGGNTASVPSGSLSLAGLAPTVSATANQTAAVPAAALTLTGVAPTVSATANQTATIPAASLALTANAPTVSATANETVTVPAASLALSGNVPTVSATQNQTVSIPAASLTLTGEIPTVTATQNQLLAVPVGSLALSGNIPAIQVGGAQTLDVPLGTLSLTGNAPTITAGADQTVGVPVGALSLAALAPSVASSANQTIAVPAADLVLTGQIPTVTATQQQYLTVPLGALALVSYAPGINPPPAVAGPRFDVFSDEARFDVIALQMRSDLMTRDVRTDITS